MSSSVRSGCEAACVEFAQRRLQPLLLPRRRHVLLPLVHRVVLRVVEEVARQVALVHRLRAVGLGLARLCGALRALLEESTRQLAAAANRSCDRPGGGRARRRRRLCALRLVCIISDAAVTTLEDKARPPAGECGRRDE